MSILVNLFFIWTFVLGNAICCSGFARAACGVYLRESFIIFTLAINKYCSHGHPREMHKLYTSTCFRVVNFISQKHSYLSRKAGKVRCYRWVLPFWNIFADFSSLLYPGTLWLLGITQRQKVAFCSNAFSLKSQNKNSVFQDSVT